MINMFFLFFYFFFYFFFFFFFFYNKKSTSKDIANSLKDLNEVEETLNRIQAHKFFQCNIFITINR